MTVFGNYDFNLCFVIFRVTSNVLELTNCSLNFYGYCLCNREIRQR